MKKSIQFMSILMLIAIHFCSNAQIKVYTDGNVCVGSTTVTPNKPLVVAKSGGIRISQTTFADSTNELVFGDNGQIRSKDDTHRIIFDRANNILELREYGDLYFSPGATSGTRTQKVTFTSGGDLVLNGSSNSFKIGTDKVLWHNNITSNIYVGVAAGVNTSGINNTFIGNSAGNANTTGNSNTAIGYNALILGNSTNYNVAIGTYSLTHLTTGSYNTACGYASINLTTSGFYNTGFGWATLYSNTTGSGNTAIGHRALNSSTTSSNNTALGYSAGFANTTGANNTFIGFGADANANNYNNAAAFGNGTIVTASNKMFFGNSSITNIQGQVNFSTYSDGRFKTNVTENVKGLEFINKLRPVTYKMNTEALDDFIIQNMPDSLKTAHKTGMDFAPSMAMLHSGFIAQEVELAAQEVGFASTIVRAPANANEPYAISYAEIVVPLVKAVQELSKTVDSLEAKTESLDSANAAQDASLQAMQNQINQMAGLINACCNIQTGRLTQQDNMTSESSANSNTSELNNNIMLYQNKPNPFNEQTLIEYYIPANSKNASIMIFDMQGKLIKTIPLEQKVNGSIKISAGSLYPGIYMYSLVVDDQEIDTKRMILTK